ncbi:MAG: hypothetical protein AAGH15_04910 [Myxococcota bacterium]
MTGETGFLTVFRVRGVPVRIHWSAPLAALILGQFRFVPGFWVGFFLIIILHELGHAVLVWRRKLTVLEMRVTGLGGVCIHNPGTYEDAMIIAWGGVLAQFALFLGAQAYALVFGLPPNAFAYELYSALTGWNLIIAALNLIPFPPFDGALAWELPKKWWRERSRRPPAKKKKRKAGETAEVIDFDAERHARELAQKALEDARKH